MRIVTLLLLGLVACKAKDDKPIRAKVPATATGSFAKIFATCGASLGGGQPDFHAAFDACAPLVGEGACREAWAAMSANGKYPDGLIHIIDACAKQHCTELDNTPRACKGPAPSGDEVVVWTELHAAIMNTLFGDELMVTSDIVETYKALPAHATVADFQRVIAAISSIDHAKATIDGRGLVFGMTARLLGAVFLEPAAALTTQTPLPL